MTLKMKAAGKVLWAFLTIVYILLLSYLICSAIVWSIANPRGGIGLIAFSVVVLIFQRAGYLILLGLWESTRLRSLCESLRSRLCFWAFWHAQQSAIARELFYLLVTEQECERLERGLKVIKWQRGYKEALNEKAKEDEGE